jgi:hypothetical protein
MELKIVNMDTIEIINPTPLMRKLIITPEGAQYIDLTPEEISIRQAQEAQAQQLQIAADNAAAQEKANKQSALNKFKALGLTDAEITALIG